jgi:hypothetical protein
MTWITLTLNNKQPVTIQIEHMVLYADAEVGAGAVITMISGKDINVKETSAQIANIITKTMI